MIENINIASTLKELRTASKLSAKEVSERLTIYNITISTKTLYGYESGLSMPNADTFLALCKIYNCENPLQIISAAKKEPPALVEANTGEVELEILRDTMESLGYIANGEDLSDSDLRFLISVGECIRAWFEGRNSQ